MIAVRSPRGPIVFDEARGVREQLFRFRRHEPEGVVVHTTGAGPWRRWDADRAKFASPHDAACYVYKHVMRASPHFLICSETGRITQLVSVGLAAWHVGSEGAWRYKRKAFQQLPRWWKARWPELKGPGDLLDGRLWRNASANQLTVGIEMSPPFDHPRGAWTNAGWSSLTWLVQYLAGDHGFPVDSYHVFTHSDADPRRRTTSNGRPWDPGTNQWSGRGVVSCMASIRLPRS